MSALNALCLNTTYDKKIKLTCGTNGKNSCTSKPAKTTYELLFYFHKTMNAGHKSKFQNDIEYFIINKYNIRSELTRLQYM